MSKVFRINRDDPCNHINARLQALVLSHATCIRKGAGSHVEDRIFKFLSTTIADRIPDSMVLPMPPNGRNSGPASKSANGNETLSLTPDHARNQWVGEVDGEEIRYPFCPDDRLSAASDAASSDQKNTFRYQTEYWELESLREQNKARWGSHAKGAPVTFPIGADDYQDYCANIIVDGCRYVGRALHIMARHDLHLGTRPTQEAIKDLFSKENTDDLMVERPELFGHRHRSSTGVADNRGRISLKSFQKLRKAFGPVAHILAAMDVILSRCYAPEKAPHRVSNADSDPSERSSRAWQDAFLHSPPGSDRQYSPETTENLRAFPGRSFLDDPNEETLTNATISYALWFQEWMTERKVEGYKNLIRIESDQHSATKVVPDRKFYFKDGRPASLQIIRRICRIEKYYCDSTKYRSDNEKNIDTKNQMHTHKTQYPQIHNRIYCYDILGQSQYCLEREWINKAYSGVESEIQVQYRQHLSAQSALSKPGLHTEYDPNAPDKSDYIMTDFDNEESDGQPMVDEPAWRAALAEYNARHGKQHAPKTESVAKIQEAHSHDFSMLMPPLPDAIAQALAAFVSPTNVGKPHRQ